MTIFEEMWELRDRMREEVPELYDLYTSDPKTLIIDKYKLNNWQEYAYRVVLLEAFLKDISLIRIQNEIKNKLKIKDDKIIKSIALDTAIHIFSRNKDYFDDTDNLIKSLGGEESYWKNYSPSYWDEKIEAIPAVSLEDIKIARTSALNSISKAEFELKKLQENDAKNLIPTLYNEITTQLINIKAKIDSEDYGLILNLDKSTIELFKKIIKAQETTLSEKRKIVTIEQEKSKEDKEKENKIREKKLAIFCAKGFIGGGILGYLINNEIILDYVHTLIYISIPILVIKIIILDAKEGYEREDRWGNFIYFGIFLIIVLLIIFAIIFWILGMMGLDSFVSFGLFFAIVLYYYGIIFKGYKSPFD